MGSFTWLSNHSNKPSHSSKNKAFQFDLHADTPKALYYLNYPQMGSSRTLHFQALCQPIARKIAAYKSSWGDCI